MTDAQPQLKKPAQWNFLPLEHVKHVVAVASGKGGVGKSTTTLGLALALKAKGLRVGILDADIYGPSIPMMMGLRKAPPPPVENDAIIPHEAAGIKAMSMGFIAGDQAAVWRGPMVTKALTQMLRGVAWGSEAEPLDILLIDMPPGTGDIHISMVQQVPLKGAVIVTTPQEVATLDAGKCLSMFANVKIPILGVIENMSYFQSPDGEKHRLFGEGGGKQMAENADLPFLGEVPLNPEIGKAADTGSLDITDEAYALLAEKVQNQL